jgi:hypothetical protein
MQIKYVSSAFCCLDLLRLGLWQPPHGSGETQFQNNSKPIGCQLHRMTLTSQFSRLKSAQAWRNAFRDRIEDTGIPKMLQDCKEVAETSS